MDFGNIFGKKFRYRVRRHARPPSRWTPPSRSSRTSRCRASRSRATRSTSPRSRRTSPGSGCGPTFPPFRLLKVHTSSLHAEFFYDELLITLDILYGTVCYVAASWRNLRDENSPTVTRFTRIWQTLPTISQHLAIHLQFLPGGFLDDSPRRSRRRLP